MADCLAERMVLTKNVSAFCWMGVNEVARGPGLMAVTWAQWIVNCVGWRLGGDNGCVESLFEGRLGG